MIFFFLLKIKCLISFHTRNGVFAAVHVYRIAFGAQIGHLRTLVAIFSCLNAQLTAITAILLQKRNFVAFLNFFKKKKRQNQIK